MTKIHNRHSIRLPGYDYTQPGYYFITICTQDRVHRFGKIVDGGMRLNDAGQWASQCWDDIPKHFPNAESDCFVVMPNHVHGIVRIDDGDGVRRATACRVPTDDAGEKFGQPIPNSIPTIIRSYKSAVTKQIHQLPGMNHIKLWQGRYWEHIVRNENELNRIRLYIHNNPQKWAMDEMNTKNET